MIALRFICGAIIFKEKNMTQEQKIEKLQERIDYFTEIGHTGLVKVLEEKMERLKNGKLKKEDIL